MQIQNNIDLAKYTTFKIGGNAKYFVAVKTKDEMVEALNYAFKNNLKYFILGGGANVLFKDDIYDGLIIKNETRNIKIEGEFVEAESGANVNLLVNICIEKGYAGLEYFAGHPGTVGGSIFINAHTKNEKGEILLLGDKVARATIFNVKLKKEQEVKRDYFNFAYDYSHLKDSKDILLSVVFKLTPEKSEVVLARSRWIVDYRKTTQNYGGHTAGCVFQNPPGTSAGKLIDECGLKGLQYKGAKISDRHANFIVNTGKANARDVLHLIDLVKKKVKERFGVELREEIIII